MQESNDFIGTVLDGKYRIDRRLGHGAMGEVYAGTHVQLDRTVAIKVLHSGLSADESFSARFAREARAAARLEHPNAVNVYDYGTREDGTAYLVMEFIEGETLRQVLAREGAFPADAAIDLIRQAASAVAAAHARGIVHRDIKPDNMMVRTTADGSGTLKVVDFGLAKMAESATQLTNHGDVLGTPKYMAPEQVSGDTVDGRADIYALGCVLFEMLAGRAPFEGRSTEVVFKHAIQPVPTFESLGVSVPPAVEQVVRHALEKDPAARPPTALDLVRELDEARSGGASVAPRARESGTMLRAGGASALGEDTGRRASSNTVATGRVELVGAEDSGSRPTRVRRRSVEVPLGRVESLPSPSRPAWHVPAAIAVVALLAVVGYFYMNWAPAAQPEAPASNRAADATTTSAPPTAPQTAAEPATSTSSGVPVSTMPVTTEPQPAAPVTATPAPATAPAATPAPAPAPVAADPAPQPPPPDHPMSPAPPPGMPPPGPDGRPPLGPDGRPIPLGPDGRPLPPPPGPDGRPPPPRPGGRPQR